MKFKKFISRSITEKPTGLSEFEVQEMTEFYLALLKIQKKRPQFNVAFVMKEVYSESAFKNFMLHFT